MRSVGTIKAAVSVIRSVGTIKAAVSVIRSAWTTKFGAPITRSAGFRKIAASYLVIAAVVLWFLFGPGQIGLAKTFAAQGIGVTEPPRHMLWAWERPENLSFINPNNTGVAYLAATIKLIPARDPIVLARHQPLNVPPGTYLMAVIRIESDGTLETSDTAEINRISSTIKSLMRPRVSAVQIDFDARKSEREWYKKFLSNLRNSMPPKMFLSITSLASWCLGDDWISQSQLPVDEVVPMFFDMGADTHSIHVALDSGNSFGHLFKSIGISDRQTKINQLFGQSRACILKPALRVYMFSRKPWTRDKADRLIREVDSWRLN